MCLLFDEKENIGYNKASIDGITVDINQSEEGMIS